MVVQTDSLIADVQWFFAQQRAPVVRTVSRFAEEEIVLPDGPFRGERFRLRRHPVAKLLFEAFESGHWNRFAVTGPTQNGKTLMGYVVPVLHHLFELNERVIIGLPTMSMANDKWTDDFLPVIAASRYADLLPTAGEGSRGGQVKRSILFRNGAELRFMAAGGSDKQRAGKTSRVLAVTETDGMDEAGETSREADKIEQLEGRTRAYGRSKRVYLECTVSIEKGRIWQEYTRGTESRIYRPCPHCGEWVSPERDDLVGWQDAADEHEARDEAAFACPICRALWTEEERWEAASKAVLVHRGQKVVGGQVVGPAPRTDTLGFRWSAIDNPFVSAGDLGAEEWRSSHSWDRDNAEKKMRQFVWCLPWVPADVDLTPLDPDAVVKRQATYKRGIVPPETVGISVGTDTGKRRLHWTATAWLPDGRGHVIDYGVQTVEADRLGVTAGLLDALQRLRSFFSWHGADGRQWQPSQVWIDSQWHEHTDAVYAFCTAANTGLRPGSEIYRPAKGYGEGQRGIGRYVTPAQRAGDIVYLGREYHLARLKRAHQLVCHVNADQWKSELHQRLAMPADQAGAIVLYEAADRGEHREFVEHLTAETQKEKWLEGRGSVIVWERIRRENHYLDSSYLAVAAGDLILALAQKPPQPAGWFKAQEARR